MLLIGRHYSIIKAMLFSFLVVQGTAIAQVATLTLQPGSSGIDANVSGATANRSTNYGTSTVLTASKSPGGSTADTLRSYLKFDLTIIPTGAVINDAKLYLYGSGNNSTSINNACYLRKVPSSPSWTEGALTWNNQPGGTSTGQISIATTTSATRNDTVNVTTHVQDMFTAGNYGWELLLQTEASGAKREYYSSDHGTASSRPKLVVTYFYNTAALTHVTCPNASTGAIDLSFSSGTSPYTYSWSPGGATTQDISSQSAGTYSVTVTDANSISRTIAIGIGYKTYFKEFYGMRQSDNGDTIVQTRPDNNWFDGVVSTNKLAASTAGWIEYMPLNTSYDRMFGFCDTSTTPGSTDIDYGLRLQTGNLYKVVSGTSTSLGVTYAANDVLRIERSGTSINYLKNGKVIHTITGTTAALVIDMAIWTKGGKFENIRASFAPPENKYFWTGRTSSDWATGSNWCYCTGTAPSSTDDIVFPKPALMSAPVITSSTATCNNINIQNTASVTITSPGNLSVAGNWYSTGTLNSGTGYVTFTGSASQSIRKNSGALTLYKVNINKSGGTLSLTGAVTISDTLKITKGKIVTTSVNLLTINDNTGVSGGSDSGYVSGPLKKVGNDVFVFPLGSTSLSSAAYHPLTITAPLVTTDAFTAEYYRATHAGTAKADTVAQSDTCEYWTLERVTGTSDVKATLQWNTNSCSTADLDDITVVSWDGVKWTDRGNSNRVSNDNGTGTITSSLSINFGASPTPITIGKKKGTPSYIPLAKRLDGTYYRTYEKKLYLKYDEKYRDGTLTYRVYDYQNNIINTSSVSVNKNYGLNWFVIDLSPVTGMTLFSYYIVELENDKGQKEYARFKFH